jgi:hypothetical protein
MKSLLNNFKRGLFFAGNDLGNIEGVVFHAAVVVEHVGEDQAVQWGGLAFR